MVLPDRGVAFICGFADHRLVCGIWIISELLERGDTFFLGELPLTVLLVLGEKKQLREIETFGQPYVILYYVVSAAAGQLLYEKGFFFVTFVWGAALAAALIKRWRDGGSLSTVKK